MDFYTTAESIKLSAAERETIKNAQARIKAAETCCCCYGTSGLDGEPSPSQLKIAELAATFKAAPTAELAAEIARHALIHENSKAISGHLAGIVSALREETSKALLPLAQELTKRTIVELDKQLAAAVAGLEKIDGMEDAIADIRARHARQVQVGNYDCGELAESHRDTLRWLVGSFQVD
jgi:hypothetical protein